ncbi:MAG TPA: branched-chain amino acid ABC transporter permease [Anaeromyxobacteraceae bacterium]|nr:branched-chain amino acid ABC transporter permease [Anaeromyxobacteraceae bacterium]
MSGPRGRWRFDRTDLGLALACAALLLAGPILPKWSVFLVTVSIAKGLVALGLLLLMRAGLVSFGQGLYFALGAYAGGVAAERWGLGEAAAMLALGVLAAAAVAALLGILLARYRTIFFAMLSLAFSMILYGLLVKTPALGSTDGFNVAPRTLASFAFQAASGRYRVMVLAAASALAAGLLVNALLRSHLGRLGPAIRDNELRVEYMGASVRRTVHLYLIISAGLAGLGGGLTGLSIGHIGPEMAYWTTSGEFVFVTILSGTGSVAAPFLGALALELLRSFAYEHAPNTWQLVVGAAMLAVILFLPSGLWSLFARRRQA